MDSFFLKYVYNKGSWRVGRQQVWLEEREIHPTLGAVHTVQFTLLCVRYEKHKSQLLILIPNFSLWYILLFSLFFSSQLFCKDI